MARPGRKPKPKSRIDYIRYDNVCHQLNVGFCDQNFTYMGIPESLYLRLALAEIPDDIFMRDVFNKYPVVVTFLPPSGFKQKEIRRKKRQSGTK